MHGDIAEDAFIYEFHLHAYALLEFHQLGMLHLFEALTLVVFLLLDVLIQLNHLACVEVRQNLVAHLIEVGALMEGYLLYEFPKGVLKQELLI